MSGAKWDEPAMWSDTPYARWLRKNNTVSYRQVTICAKIATAQPDAIDRVELLAPGPHG